MRELNLLDWEPTGDFGDAHPRSRLSGWDLIRVSGLGMILEAWEIEMTGDDEVYRAVNPDLRADLDAFHGAVMSDGAFQMAEVQFPDESTPRLYVVFAYPEGT